MTINYHGLIVLDKPSGITSRAAVDHAQKWLPRGTRIGHTGTLDPLASGVLVLCIGNATRLAEYVQDMSKVYRAGIVLGATSDSDDADGTITATAAAPIPDHAQIAQALASFVGTIAQTPPAYSAAKVNGRRAYKLARNGQEVELQPRKVTIYGIDIESHAHPHLQIVVRCGKGTYIRALARDLGQTLGCGGYIASLRRLQVGSFRTEEALSLDTAAATALRRLLPAWRAVQDQPPLRMSVEQLAMLRQGQRLSVPAEIHDKRGPIAVTDDADQTAAIVEVVDGQVRPVKVLV
jgi:tRNA pseudouridine55 synthase